MFSFNGIGTKLYGKREVDQTNGSYIATKWFILAFLPIIPLESYRVIREKQKFLAAGPTRYQMQKVETNRRQIINTYSVWWGSLIVFIIFCVFLSKIGQ